MRDTFVRTLTALAENRPDVMLLTADLGFGVLEDFRCRFPRQFLNVGIAEQNMTGIAAGLALEGRTVFTYSLGGFPTVRCLEQIRNDVCYHGTNVRIVTVGGGMSYGAVGATHHATEDLAIMRSLPNMVVVSPGDLWEAEEATKAILDIRGPVYLRLDKSTAPATNKPGEKFELGKTRTLLDGSDVTLAATGGAVCEALRAAHILASHGVSARVLSVHSLKPFDNASLSAAAQETAGILTIEEHAVEGGLGGAVAESLLESHSIPGFFTRLGLRSCFSSTVGSQTYLRKVYGLDAVSIGDAAIACIRTLSESQVML